MMWFPLLWIPLFLISPVAEGNEYFTPVRASLSTDPSGDANENSFDVDISGNGRWVVFRTNATNLVDPPAGSNIFQIYAFDTQNPTTPPVVISTNTNGDHANNFCTNPALSKTGHYVVFSSSASNLSPEGLADTNGTKDIYWKDRDVSGSGVFDTPGNTRVKRISLNNLGQQVSATTNEGADISGDGEWVTFFSNGIFDTTVGDISNSTQDVFLVNVNDISSMKNMSVLPNGLRSQLGGVAQRPRVSDDGRYVVFESTILGLDHYYPSHSAGPHVFWRDTQGSTPQGSGRTVLVDVKSDNTPTTTGVNQLPDISGDGNYIAWQSDSDNLISNGSTFNQFHAYRRGPMKNIGKSANLTIAPIDRLSTHANGTLGDDHSYAPRLSQNGDSVIFLTDANNLVDNMPTAAQAHRHVFAKQISTNIVKPVSVNGIGQYGDAGSPDLLNLTVYGLALTDWGFGVAMISRTSQLNHPLVWPDGLQDGNGFLDIYYNEVLMTASP